MTDPTASTRSRATSRSARSSCSWSRSASSVALCTTRCRLQRVRDHGPDDGAAQQPDAPAAQHERRPGRQHSAHRRLHRLGRRHGVRVRKDGHRSRASSRGLGSTVAFTCTAATAPGRISSRQALRAAATTTAAGATTAAGPAARTKSPLDRLPERARRPARLRRLAGASTSTTWSCSTARAAAGPTRQPATTPTCATTSTAAVACSRATTAGTGSATTAAPRTAPAAPTPRAWPLSGTFDCNGDGNTVDTGTGIVSLGRPA